MPFLEIQSVYHVVPEERAVDFHDASNLLLLDNTALLPPYNSPVWVSGIQRHDLAAFGVIIDETGVTPVDYLVGQASQNNGFLVPSTTVEENPDSYATSELAKKFATLTAEEIAQFGISRVISDYVSRRYPGIKGLTR